MGESPDSRPSENVPVPGLLIIRPDKGLFFANAAPCAETGAGAGG